MKSFTTVVGIILIIGGIFVLSYQGFQYTENEKVADIKIPAVGHLEVTEQTHKDVYFPPLLGGLSLAVGIALVIIARLKK